MKKVIACLLLFSIAISSFGSTILFVHYRLNKNYYAKVLCENRNKPMLHCNGKCKLTKELKELERKAEAPFSPLKEKQDNIQFFEYSSEPSFAIEKLTRQFYTSYSKQTLPEVYFSFFHPPSV